MSCMLKDILTALKKQDLLTIDQSQACGENACIAGVSYDNRKITPGGLFVCKGAAFRLSYLEAAIDGGVLLYVSEIAYIPSFPHLLVKDIRAAMAVIARAFYGKTVEELVKIGVTGTKGKTTVCSFLHSILDYESRHRWACRSAILSSLEIYDGTEQGSAHLSTPEAFDLWRHLANASANQFRYAVCEVSSQALKYRRTDGIHFDVAAFLNIGEDHISEVEHKDFEDYLSSKLKIFSQSDVACINSRTACFSRIRAAAKAARCRVVTFGFSPKDNVFCSDYKRCSDGTRFAVRFQGKEERYMIGLAGQYNIENALAAVAISKICGISYVSIAEGLASTVVPGRGITYATRDDKIHAIVDYAHNKMSMEALLNFVAAEYPEQSVIIVFGCPGGKARNRRRDMGLLAGGYADKVIITEDDPGPEPLTEICAEIAGYVSSSGTACEIIYDRGKAIHRAFESLPDGGVILICGKGVEKTQKRENGEAPYETDGFYVRQGIEQYEIRTLLKRV